MAYYEDIAIVIPAYDPDQKLVQLVKKITSYNFQHIIIVNDGSNSESENIFSELTNTCTILHHAANLGKGRALKTAFNFILNHHKDLIGIVTVDADGQHTIKDIEKVSKKLKEKDHNLVLGVRNFQAENIPYRSRFGNILTKKVLGFACGINITDTQTGLRGIPTHFLKKLLNVPGERFEYELNMLLEAKENAISIEEVGIQTIYLEDNNSSHFNPLTDSIKIYSILIKYLFSSLTSFGVDILSFILLSMLLKEALPHYFIIASSIGSRVLSSVFNYSLNKNAVFKHYSKTTKFKYFILSFCQMLFSAYALHLLYYLFGSGEVYLKMLVDGFLFFISFAIQRKWVFVKKTTKKSEILISL